MEYRGNNAWKNNHQKYTREQVYAVLSNLGIRVVGETHAVLMALCPFHGNRDTPSFSVNVNNGLFICFNPGCDVDGNLIHLVKRLTQRNDFEALRFIKRITGNIELTSNDELEQDAAAFEWKPWDLDKLAALRAGFPGSKGERYMVDKRKFTLETCDTFEVGYSAAQDMVTVPLHSPDGVPVGIIGRSVEGKSFKNSSGLPRSKTLFNLNRARRQGDIGIVVESSFGAMRVHQAGFPNVVGTLGGHISPENIANLNRNFSMIIIMTDFDNKKDHILPNCRQHGPGKCIGHSPGRELGMKIADSLRNKNILWATYDYKEVYPRGEKDEGNLSDAEIAQCINNAVSHFEYISWGIDFQ